MTIDILLPYYGDDPLFRTAVLSVLKQTYTDWRLVCVEDGHPRGNADDWLASLGDSRIVTDNNVANLGVARNFARCLGLVQATHFVMMGSDDIMLPEHLDTLHRARLNHPDGAVFQTGVEVIDSEGRTSLPLGDRVKSMLRPNTQHGDVVLADEKLAISLTRADWAYFPSLMWNSRMAKDVGFDQQFAIALDLGLLLDIAIAGGTFIVVHPSTFQYRRHSASVSMSAARSGARFHQEKEFFWHYAKKFDARGWRKATRVARHHYISRLNAVTELPGSVLSRDGEALAALIRHVVRARP